VLSRGATPTRFQALMTGGVNVRVLAKKSITTTISLGITAGLGANGRPIAMRPISLKEVSSEESND
jgi:hypothetical protein